MTIIMTNETIGVTATLYAQMFAGEKTTLKQASGFILHTAHPIDGGFRDSDQRFEELLAATGTLNCPDMRQETSMRQENKNRAGTSSPNVEMIEGHLAIEAPENVPLWDIDPFDPEVLTHPEPYYAELRSKGPFAYLSRYAMLSCGRYGETREVFSDWERFVSSRGVGLSDFSLEKPWRPPSIVLEVDPPAHDRTRKVMMRALSPRAVTMTKAIFQQEAAQLVDALIERSEFDAVPDLAESFQTTVFPRAIGMVENDRQRLLDYGAMVFNALGPDNELRKSTMAEIPQIVPWITEQCGREQIRADGLAATIHDAARADELTVEEAGMLVRSLLSAGVDTFVTSLGNAIWCFAQYPDQYEKLLQTPDLVRPAFEEVLRFTSPVHSFCRTAAIDTEVSGIAIQAGTKILCVLGSANLDPEQWPQADHFEIARKPVGHLAFGVGIHTCVGQILARAEAEAIFAALIRRVKRIEQTGEAVWRANNAIHALDSLPVRFIPR